MELFEVKVSDVVLLASVFDLTLALVTPKTVDTIKQAATRLADDCTSAHEYLHGNRGFSPWLLLGKRPSDKPVCEHPDLAQCSEEVVDGAAKRRLQVNEGGAPTSKKSRRNSHSSTLEASGWRSGTNSRFPEQCVLWSSPCVFSRARKDR